MSLIAATVAFVIALLGALFAIDRWARRIYDYIVTPSEFVIRLFGRFAIYRIARTDIAAAELWRASRPTFGTVFSTLHLGNRIIGKPVRITRRRGFPRYLVITPDDAQATIAQLRSDGRLS